VDGVGPNDLRNNELVERVKAGGVKEVIIATNPMWRRSDGLVHCAAAQAHGVACSRIAHGIPIGGNLE
jgi:recombination protein RecR